MASRVIVTNARWGSLLFLGLAVGSLSGCGSADGDIVGKLHQAIWNAPIDDAPCGGTQPVCPVNNSVAYLQTTSQTDPSGCTGTFLTYELVLTADHCFAADGKRGANYDVVKRGSVFHQVGDPWHTGEGNGGQDLMLVQVTPPEADPGSEDAFDEMYPQKPTFRPVYFYEGNSVQGFAGYGDTEEGEGNIYRRIQDGNLLPESSIDGNLITLRFGDPYWGPDHGDSGGPIWANLRMGYAPRTSDHARDQLGVTSRGGPAAGVVQWANILEVTNWVNIVNHARSPTRPMRWIGERDYVGPKRPSVDENGDRYFDANTGTCPVIFDTGGDPIYTQDLHEQPVAIYASDRLTLDDRVKVFKQDNTLGDVAVSAIGRRAEGFPGTPAGSVSIGVEGRVGRVLARGGVEVRDRGRAEYVMTSGEVVGNVGEIDAAPASLPDVRLSTDFAGELLPLASVGPDEHVEECLPAGRYERLDLRSRSSLTLCGGVYHFEDFSTQPESTLSIPNDTVIHVRDDFEYKGAIAGNAADIVFAVWTSRTVFVANSLVGTLVAPLAHVELASLPHFGSVAARQVTVHQDSIFTHVPLDCR